MAYQHVLYTMRTANLAAAQDILTDPMRDEGGQLDRAFNHGHQADGVGRARFQP